MNGLFVTVLFHCSFLLPVEIMQRFVVHACITKLQAKIWVYFEQMCIRRRVRDGQVSVASRRTNKISG